MLQMFRSFFKSKVGIVVTLLFLGIIAIAFASSDVANNSTFGGVTGGDRVAVVGERRIDTAELSMIASSAVQRLRADNPTLTMEAFIDNGGLEDTLENLIQRSSLAELARESGLRAGTRLVDSEIRNTPQFRSFDGSFDADAFRSALRQQGLSEAAVRDDLAMGLLARPQITPLTLAPQMPRSIAVRYAGLLRERRVGSIASIPAGAFAPEGEPTDAQLQAYYTENRSNYIRPERRVIRYASFGEDAFGDIPEPTDAQITERYRRDRENYAERQARSFTQIVVPTQAAAQAVVAEVQGGQSLQAAARAKGLATAQVATATQAELASQTSPAVAEAGFAATRGGLSEPARGPLGWYVLRVDEVERRAARSPAQAREDIVTQLRTEQRRKALNDATARIEDEFTRGKSLSEVARELGVELRTTRPVTAAGQVYGTQESAPAELERVLPVAFEMDTAEPQLAEIEPGKSFLVYDVSQITRSATAPMSEIRDQLEVAWRVDEGMTKAGEAAKRILKRIADGKSLREAVQAEDVRLPAPQPLNLTRQQVAEMGQLPPPVALYFSMAEGTVKRLANRQNLAWVILNLDDIQTPELADDDPIIAATVQQLQSALGEEYTAQYVAAARAGTDVEVNRVAVDAVARQLTGRPE